MLCWTLCCFGSACCSCCCRGLAACSVPAKNYPKAAYVAFDFILMLIATFVMYALRPIAEDNDWIYCNEGSGGGDECFGTSAVLRASFILFCYHLLILLFLIPRGNCSSVVHDGFFLFKFLVVFGAYIASFWMSNDFFDGWGNFCRVGSILYLIVQSYFLMNFAYMWNDKLMSVVEASNYAKFLLIGSSILMAILIILWLVLQFIYYASCGLGVTVLSITVVFILFFYVIAFLPFCCDVNIFRPNASIFVVGFSMLYVVFLSWSALASQPDLECNQMLDSGANTTF